MSLSEFATDISDNILNMSFIEIVATITALLYILLATKGYRSCFLFGGISSILFVWIAIYTRYYFDASINIYYIVMSVVGWLNWTPGTNDGVIRVEEMNRKSLIRWLLISGVISVVVAFVVDKLSDPSLVYLDSFTTVFAILATWMLVKKYKENWLIWIAVDAVGAGMYYYKELYFVSSLFVVYTFFAIYGYLEWNRIQKKHLPA